MATKTEHIYAIQNIINKGVKSDDSNYSNKLVGHYLDMSKAILIKRKLDKYHTLSDTNYQTICVTLEEDTYHDCSCIPAELGCKILKSKCPLPKEIVKRWASTISIKYADGRTMSRTSVTKDQYSEYSLTNKNKKEGWDIEDQHLLIFGNLDLKVVLAKAIWETDPINYCDCNENALSTKAGCISEQSEYSIDSDLVVPMYEMVLQFMGIMQKYPEDNENNGKSVTTTNEKEV